MNAEEAFERSQAGVIRNRYETGLLSIARSPEGYHLSEIPQSDSKTWDLAHTRTVGKWRVLSRALAEAERRGASADNWEPAPENIIGNEPAVSVAPAGDGTEMRTHGYRESAARLFLQDQVRLLAGVQLSAAALLAAGRLFRNRRAERTLTLIAALGLTGSALYTLRAGTKHDESGGG